MFTGALQVLAMTSLALVASQSILSDVFETQSVSISSVDFESILASVSADDYSTTWLTTTVTTTPADYYTRQDASLSSMDPLFSALSSNSEDFSFATQTYAYINAAPTVGDVLAKHDPRADILRIPRPLPDQFLAPQRPLRAPRTLHFCRVARPLVETSQHGRSYVVSCLQQHPSHSLYL